MLRFAVLMTTGCLPVLLPALTDDFIKPPSKAKNCISLIFSMFTMANYLSKYAYDII